MKQTIIMLALVLIGASISQAQSKEALYRDKIHTNAYFSGAGGDSLFVHANDELRVAAYFWNIGPDTALIARENDTTYAKWLHRLAPGKEVWLTFKGKYMRIAATGTNDSARVVVSIPIRE